jgi:hypothetical protein
MVPSQRQRQLLIALVIVNYYYIFSEFQYFRLLSIIINLLSSVRGY